MDALALHEIVRMFSCCELCVQNRRWKQFVLVVTFVLMTFDMVTDWINWTQWSGVGGYDQYYFASIFEKLFLCVAAVGSGLWIIEVFVIIKKWNRIYHGHHQRIPSKYHRNFQEFLPKPDINYSVFECIPKINDDDKSPSEPKVRNDEKPPSQPEVRNDNKIPSDSNVRNDDKLSSEPDARNNTKLPSELEVSNASEPDSRDDDKPLSEPDPRNNDKPTSELIDRSDNKPASEPQIKNDDNPPCQQKVRNDDQQKSELEVRNCDEFGRNEDEQQEKFNGSRAIHRLGILVRILVGLCEDFPVILAVFYPTVMPMCGATIVSSMLNSLWTMILLFCELWGCTERGLCCMTTAKQKNGMHVNVEDTDMNTFEHRHSKLYSKKAFLKAGKLIVSMVIFIIFTTTFTLGLWTIGHVLSFIDLKLIYIGPFRLRSAIVTSYFGPGLDAKPDQAMFIYLHYQLPDWHYITLNDNNFTKSTSFHKVINRLYIGQFEELSHLKDGTLIKAIPCTRAMPFLRKIDERTFNWTNYHPASEMVYGSCKIIFTLRYHPTNNNWQPFTNFIHDYEKCITIDYGIHINNENSCPKWFNPPSSYSFLSQQVQEDIMNYTCNSACGEDSEICPNVKSWNIDCVGGVNSSDESVELWDLSLVIHDLKIPDTCGFKVYFEHLHKFCDTSWGEIEPVKVPEEIENTYPQFITVPIITWYDKNLDLWIFEKGCDKLWQSKKHSEVE